MSHQPPIQHTTSPIKPTCFVSRILDLSGIPRNFSGRQLLFDYVDSGIDHQIITHRLGPVTVDPLIKSSDGAPLSALIDAGDILLLVLFDGSRVPTRTLLEIGWEQYATERGYIVLRAEDPTGFEGSAFMSHTRELIMATAEQIPCAPRPDATPQFDKGKSL